MTDRQKIYCGYICVEEVLEKGIIKAMIKVYDQCEPVEKPIQSYYLHNVSFLPEDDKVVKQKPLWVLQQENKKLWRK